MDLAHCKPVEEVAAHFSVDETVGLQDDAIKKSLEKFGPNGEYITFLTPVINNNFQ